MKEIFIIIDENNPSLSVIRPSIIPKVVNGTLTIMNHKPFDYIESITIYNDKNVKFIPVRSYAKRVHFLSIMYCSLISLKHSPRVVLTHFKIIKNNVKTLYYCPKRVGERIIDYSFNTLVSSDFLPLTFEVCYDHLR